MRHTYISENYNQRIKMLCNSRTRDLDLQICLLTAEADRRSGDFAPDAALCSLVWRQYARIHGLIYPHHIVPILFLAALAALYLPT